MKKIIGIISRPDKNITNKECYIVLESFKNIVIDFDFLPLGIIPNIKDINKKMNNNETKELNNLLNLCDGIILQGGDKFYDYDKCVVKYAIDRDIPILGICLGAQVMASIDSNNVEKIDLKKYNNHNQDKEYVHEIVIDKNSKLYEILKKDKIKVNSYHIEKINNPGIYKTSAYSPDGIIEAIEYSKNKFNIGVQFHPEKIYKDKNMYKIFKSFFNQINS